MTQNFGDNRAYEADIDEIDTRQHRQGHHLLAETPSKLVQLSTGLTEAQLH